MDKTVFRNIKNQNRESFFKTFVSADQCCLWVADNMSNNRYGYEVICMIWASSKRDLWQF